MLNLVGIHLLMLLLGEYTIHHTLGLLSMMKSFMCDVYVYVYVYSAIDKQSRHGVVFLLWGLPAQKKGKLITDPYAPTPPIITIPLTH
jgi:hypothetical protein